MTAAAQYLRARAARRSRARAICPALSAVPGNPDPDKTRVSPGEGAGPFWYAPCRHPEAFGACRHEDCMEFWADHHGHWAAPGGFACGPGCGQ